MSTDRVPKRVYEGIKLSPDGVNEIEVRFAEAGEKIEVSTETIEIILSNARNPRARARFQKDFAVQQTE